MQRTALVVFSLGQRRGEVGQGEEGGVNFFDEFAVGFGFVSNTLPRGVVLKGFPIRGCRFAAGMLEDVGEGVG
jgi:hypothetical protein